MGWLIDGVDVDDQTYEAAWDWLEENYGASVLHEDVEWREVMIRRYAENGGPLDGSDA